MWIDCSNSLPKQGGVYLATDCIDVAVCTYLPNLIPRFPWAKLETEEIFKPTHYMPLPNNPKNEIKSSKVCGIRCPNCEKYLDVSLAISQ